MRNNWIPEKLIPLTKKREGTVCKVTHEGHLSKIYEVKAEVRQCCLLFPFMFILAIDCYNENTTTGR